MRLLGAELLKIKTAPRTLVGLLLAELAIVAIGTASTIDSALVSSLLRRARFSLTIVCRSSMW